MSIARATGPAAWTGFPCGLPSARPGGLAFGIASAAAAALLTGCAHGHVLADSSAELDSDPGAVLGSDARAVLAAGAERLGAPGARPTVVLDTTKPCPGGRPQRIYRARLPLQPGATNGVVLDRATALSIDLIGARGYRLDRPPRHRTFSMTRQGPTVTVTVRLRGGRRPAMELDANTPCRAAN